MPKILVISRHFPPLGSAGGSIRLVKFLKYTSSDKWKFIVLTQDLKKTVVPEEQLSESLLDDISPDIQIERVAAPFRGEAGSYGFRAGKFLSQKIFKDSSILWGMRVFLKGALNFKHWKVNLIHSVSPPFTDAFIGALLAAISRKPYVLDLKDDWVGSPDFLKKNILKRKVESLLEKLIIQSASAIITVTEQSRQLYAKRYERMAQEGRIYCIPNGTDLEEYKKITNKQRKIETEKFTILSAVWGFRKNYRDLTPFLASLSIFFEQNPKARQNTTVILLGNSLSDEYKNTIAELGLQKVIKEMGAVNRQELVNLMWKADLLLLIQPNGNKTAISGTLYEYWAVGKAPVLLISEKGASSALVERHKIGRHFHFFETKECAEYMETLYVKYQNESPEWISKEGVEDFDRQKLASQMALVWQKVWTDF